MEITGIYKIQSKQRPHKCYIGSSVNINKRWCTHLSLLNINKHKNPKLQKHYNKYGKNDLVFTILVCCDVENLIANEQFFIDSYKPWFNCREKAESNIGLVPWTKGRKPSEETRLKISRANKGRKHTDQWKARQSKAMMGKKNALGSKMSDEVKKKMSIINMGNKYSVGNKNSLGSHRSDEWKKQHSILLKSKETHWTEEHREKFKKTRMGYKSKLRGKPWSDKRRKAQELKKAV